MSKRVTQAELMLKMLREARYHGHRVPSSAFVAAGMFRYGAVKFKLEERGHKIECEPRERGTNTYVYWLERDAECTCADTPLFCKVHGL